MQECKNERDQIRADDAKRRPAARTAKQFFAMNTDVHTRCGGDFANCTDKEKKQFAEMAAFERYKTYVDDFEDGGLTPNDVAGDGVET